MTNIAPKLVYNMPYTTQEERQEVKELVSTLYQKYDIVNQYPQGNFAMLVEATGEKEKQYTQDELNSKILTLLCDQEIGNLIKAGHLKELGSEEALGAMIFAQHAREKITKLINDNQ